MQTLVFLAQNHGRTIPRQEFFDSVWKGLVVNEEALSRAISLLRTTLGDDAQAPSFIQTIPGVGYRLIAEVSNTQELPDSAPSASGAPRNSIAVLPFINLSDDPANEYFSDGISEEILNDLAQVDHFKVVGRTSSFAFKDRNEDLRQIGRTLDVAHVLEGSVRKAGQRVRITAQLIKTEDGFHLWSETFDHELEDIFAIQDEIASAVVKALKLKLLGKSGEHHSTGGTHNTEAFQAYLKGLHFHNRGNLRGTIQRAADAFRLAIDLDPGYARAWAGLALTWNDLLWNSFVEWEEGKRQMHLAASRAVELAPDFAGGHLALGLLWQLYPPRWDDAQEAINAAVELNPGNAQVLIEYARINCNLAKHETSIEAARKALELDPVSVYANHFLGHVLYFARRYEEAIPAFRQALELDPHFPKPHYFIAMSLYWLGDPEGALQEIRLEPLTWMRLTGSATILHRLGRTGESETTLDKLIEMGVEETNYIQQADVYSERGEVDRAIEKLQLALENSDPGLTQTMMDPFLDRCRDDPRFKSILSKAGFPVTA